MRKGSRPLASRKQQRGVRPLPRPELRTRPFGDFPVRRSPSPRIASSFAFLRPVLRLAAPIAQLHLLAPGETAGYGGGFEARRPTRLAVVPLGYGDGIFRALGGGRGEALVWGRRVPIVGRVSMDALFVDVTDVPEASVGDSVVFLGTQGTESISPWEVADRLGTIAYEVLTQLGPRLARVLRG